MIFGVKIQMIQLWWFLDTVWVQPNALRSSTIFIFSISCLNQCRFFGGKDSSQKYTSFKHHWAAYELKSRMGRIGSRLAGVLHHCLTEIYDHHLCYRVRRRQKGSKMEGFSTTEIRGVHMEFARKAFVLSQKIISTLLIAIGSNKREFLLKILLS